MQQFKAQFEPQLKVELSFINRVCKLNEAERRKLITKSKTWLESFIRDFAARGGQPNVEGMWFGGGPQPPDPRASFDAGLQQLVAAELSKEHAKLYADECKSRAAFEKDVAVDNLVTKIDGELMLSRNQREELRDSLAKNWQDSWAPKIEFFMMGADMWPNVPDQFIRPHLTPAQVTAWSRLNKQSGNMFWGGNLAMQNQVIEDIDLDEGEEKPAEEEPKDVAGPYQVAPAPGLAE
jgi:hypothetical protein